MVTETPELTAALDRAALTWPNTPRAELLSRLAMAGLAQLDEDRARTMSERREAVRVISGLMTGLYEPGHLDTLRSEWPT